MEQRASPSPFPLFSPLSKTEMRSQFQPHQLHFPAIICNCDKCTQPQFKTLLVGYYFPIASPIVVWISSFLGSIDPPFGLSSLTLFSRSTVSCHLTVGVFPSYTSASGFCHALNCISSKFNTLKH